jgi:hypothetical protein
MRELVQLIKVETVVGKVGLVGTKVALVAI